MNILRGSTSQSAAATLDESTPPERNTPRGTSDRRCRATASRNIFQKLAEASANGWLASSGSGNGDCQYRGNSDRAVFPDQDWPARKLQIPSQIECGAGMYS